MSLFAFNPRDFALSFISIMLEGIPFILIGTLLSGFIEAFLPSKWMERILPKSRLGAVAACGLLGLIFPVCECGSVPVIRRLIGKGLPLSCAVTYMLSSPIINPLVIISTWAAFRGQDPLMVTSMRLAMGYVIALVAGWVILRIPTERILQPALLSHSASGQAGRSDGPLLGKIRHALVVGGGDFLDITCYLALGAAAASLFNTGLDQSRIESVAGHPVLSIPMMMGMAGILSLCSSSDAFVAASFLTFPMAAKMAFLVFGPMVDLKLVFLYSSVFRKRFVLLMVLAIALAVFILCLRLDHLYV